MIRTLLTSFALSRLPDEPSGVFIDVLYWGTWADDT